MKNLEALDREIGNWLPAEIVDSSVLRGVCWVRIYLPNRKTKVRPINRVEIRQVLISRKEAKRITNDLIDNVYSKPLPTKWDIQLGRNPWFSLGIHIDHKEPSITFHLPGIIIYVGKCVQPGLKFWNKMVPEAIRHGREK